MAAFPPTRDEALDLVLGLAHDLGKHARLPVAMLPANAGQAEIRRALEDGLLRTRRGPDGMRSARRIWEDFDALAALSLGRLPAYAELRAAVERALGLQTSLSDARDLSRAEILAILEAVSTAARALAEEVRRGE